MSNVSSIAMKINNDVGLSYLRTMLINISIIIIITISIPIY